MLKYFSMDKLLNSISNNSYIQFSWEDPDSNTLVKVISISNFDNNVSSFINVITFPYVNTTYNELLKNSFNELTSARRREVKKIIEKYLKDIDLKEYDMFKRKTKEELKEEFGFEEKDLENSKENLYSNVKGGYYCEMLLCNILKSLGFEKIISKLYFQYGLVSPTGIDVPFIDINNKILILGECKLYKDIKAAIRSCMKDLDAIYNKTKLERDYDEWNAKFTSTSKTFSTFIEDNNIDTVEDLKNAMNRIICLGFVVGNKIDETSLKDYLKGLVDYTRKTKYDIIIVSVPINSKDDFVEKCVRELSEMEGF